MSVPKSWSKHHRPRVLFLANVPAPYRVSFFNELAKYCDLTVIFERSNASDRDPRWVSEAAQKYTHVQLRGIPIMNDGAIAPRVLGFLKTKKFDLIIVGGYGTPNGAMCVAYLKASGIPYLLNTDGGFAKETRGGRYYLKKALVSGAEAWLSTSESATDYLEHYGATRAKVHEYPFSSVLERDLLSKPRSQSEKVMMRQDLRIPYNRMVLSVSRHLEYKRLDVLVRAAALMPSGVGVYIVGGQPSEGLAALVKDLRVTNVHFVDFLDQELVRHYMQAADIFTITSEYEIYGLVVTEAMAQGVPVVSSDTCLAGVELIQDRHNGMLVPTGDSTALAEALIEALGDENLRLAMAAQALCTARQWTIEKMARRHAEIFREVLGGRR